MNLIMKYFLNELSEQWNKFDFKVQDASNTPRALLRRKFNWKLDIYNVTEQNLKNYLLKM